MLPVTITADDPMTALTERGVRVPVSPEALAGAGLEAVHPGQRLLARMDDGVVVELSVLNAPVVVHLPTATTQF